MITVICLTIYVIVPVTPKMTLTIRTVWDCIPVKIITWNNTMPRLSVIGLIFHHLTYAVSKLITTCQFEASASHQIFPQRHFIEVGTKCRVHRHWSWMLKLILCEWIVRRPVSQGLRNKIDEWHVGLMPDLPPDDYSCVTSRYIINIESKKFIDYERLIGEILTCFCSPIILRSLHIQKVSICHVMMTKWFPSYFNNVVFHSFMQVLSITWLIVPIASNG